MNSDEKIAKPLIYQTYDPKTVEVGVAGIHRLES